MCGSYINAKVIYRFAVKVCREKRVSGEHWDFFFSDEVNKKKYLITALLKFNCVFGTTVATQCTFQSSS